MQGTIQATINQRAYENLKVTLNFNSLNEYQQVKKFLMGEAVELHGKFSEIDYQRKVAQQENKPGKTVEVKGTTYKEW